MTASRKKITKKELEQRRRLAWFQEARFGMFVCWGLYSQLGRHEWVMNRERIPLKEYEKLAATWRPKPGVAREWARLAKQGGMKYMVLICRHHEGFCLWDSKLSDYNSVKCGPGPGRDIVAEFVAACREFGLRVGIYNTLMDWHHPDGARCAKDAKARRRFIDYTHGLTRELMANYGKIDLLWYDVPWPLRTARAWASRKLNAMVRRLQPEIVINNRSCLPEDFDTPEERVVVSAEGRAWESCMTFNGSWGAMPCSPDWRSVREVIGVIQQVAAGYGNLLLDLGPAPDGSAPPEAVERLTAIGKWLAKNGEAVYGKLDRTGGRLDIQPIGQWTLRGKTAYLWVSRWPGSVITIGGLRTKLCQASFLATGKRITFEQKGRQLFLKGLPEKNPDKIAGVTVLKLEFKSQPIQKLGFGCIL